MSYEELLEEADAAGLVAKEMPLLNNDGRIKGDVLKSQRTPERAD